MTDWQRVFEAVLGGAETSYSVAHATGMTVKVASAHLSDLSKRGVIRVLLREKVRFKRRGGQWCNVYVPVERPGDHCEGEGTE